MPITINTYCRVNRNGSININTDPLFGFTTTTTTSTTTTTTTINLNDFVCYQGYETYTLVGTSTVQGVTRGIYDAFNGYATIQLVGDPLGPTWAIWNDQDPSIISSTRPVPDYPWQASWGVGFSITQGPC